MLTKTTHTKSKADNLICLSTAVVIDNVEVRLAPGITCPYCDVTIRNDPHMTVRGWAWVCPNGHTIAEVEYL